MLYKIDIHNHTKEGSSCSILPASLLIEIAIKLRLDGICITDHHNYRNGKRIQEEYKNSKIKIFYGQEITTSEGDILVFGSDRNYNRMIDFKDLAKEVLSDGGIMIAAHPYRDWSMGLGDNILKYKNFLHGVEVFNTHCSYEENLLAFNIANLSDLAMFGGSDAHSPDAVGICWTEFDIDFELNSNEDFIKAVKTKKVKPFMRRI